MPISTGLGQKPLPAMMWVQTAQPMTISATAGPDRAADPGRPVGDVAGGLQREEGRAVQDADRHQGDAGVDAVGLEQVPERPGVVLALVDRQPGQQVTQGDADQQRDEQAAAGEQAVPHPPPGRAVALAAELEGGAAGHQRRQQQHQRQVEGGEPGGVPAGEGGEDGGAGHDQPHLVAVPQRPDRVDHRAPPGLVAADDPVQHADAQVEPLQHEEAGPQHGDEDEPELGERHRGGLPSVSTASRARGCPVRRPSPRTGPGRVRGASTAA